MTQCDYPIMTTHHALDIAANRSAQKWTPRELLGRLLWDAVEGPFFRWTPRQIWWIRNAILRLFGARIGDNVHIHPSVRIAIPWNLDIGDDVAVGDRAILYSLGRIRIGARTCISQQAHICAGTHDATRSDMPLLKLPIEIGEGVWICADAFIGPAVHIGNYSIVGARAVVVKDVPDHSVVVGNPGRVIGSRKTIQSHDL